VPGFGAAGILIGGRRQLLNGEESWIHDLGIVAQTNIDRSRRRVRNRQGGTQKAVGHRYRMGELRIAGHGVDEK
jgi:hypothetical protein